MVEELGDEVGEVEGGIDADGCEGCAGAVVGGKFFWAEIAELWGGFVRIFNV